MIISPENIKIDIPSMLDMGNYIYKDIPKSYAGGIANLIARNKKVIHAAAIANDDGRNFFKIDYTATDIQALQNFKVESFNVAGVGSYKLQEELKQLAIDVWQNKESNVKLFEEQARKKILEYVPVTDVPPGAYLKTNFNTGLAGAYHGAEFIRLQDPSMLKVYPGYKYMTRNDSVVRPEHEELHGKIFRADDKIWLVIYPPNGWNCRCFVIQLDINEVGELSASDENNFMELSSSKRKEFISKAGIDSDFDHNPGAVKSIWQKWIDSELKNIDYDKVYTAMKQYADENKAKDINVSSKQLQIIKEANKLLGNDTPRLITDVQKDLLILNLPKEMQKNVMSIINSPSETWGKTKWENGIQTSEVHYLKYTDKGVLVATSLNGEIVSVENVTPAYADKNYRRGTLIYYTFK